MSIDALRWAKKVKTGSSSSKSVLTWLADMCGADLCAYPSVSALAEVYGVIVGRYCLRKSKLQMANELHIKHPDWALITCRRRVDTWISLAESLLYAPLCDAFGTNSDRFKLQSEQESA
ncbi:DUF1133 family protein [Escherichia coli]